MALVAMCASVVGFAQAPAPATSQPSTASGVFTAEQARRGQAAYVGECALCHGQDLTGNESPALVGAAFFAEWEGQTVGALYERVKDTMPQDSPGRLSLQQYADITAFLLSGNGFPAGSTELAPDLAALRRIEWAKSR